MMTREYWTKAVDEQFEQQAGDIDDRWQTLRSNFSVREEFNSFEEFDGANHSKAEYMVLVVSLPLLVRGHSVQMRALDEIIQVRVPNLYKL